MILNVTLDLPEDGAYLRIARRLGRTLLEDLGVVKRDIDDMSGKQGSMVYTRARSGPTRRILVVPAHTGAVTGAG